MFQNQTIRKKYQIQFLSTIVTLSSATGTIILTGYFQSAVEEIYEMLTSDIKISMKSIIKAQVSQAKEFDQYVAQTVTKCIIAATYTERMNLLIEGRDTGQVTDLYYKAGKSE